MFPDGHSQLVESVDAFDLLSLMSQVGEAVVLVDSHWVVKFCNDVYLKNLGKARQEVIGRTPFDFVPAFNRSIFYEAIEQCRQTRRPMTRIGFSTVLNRWLMVRVFPVGDGMVMLANDATESVVKQFQLAQKVVKDSLTGLGNKLAMEQKVDRLVHNQEAFSIIVLGVDRFREVNQNHGYAAGDMVLLELASGLQSATLGGESLYRVSGDEFAVIREGEADGASERAMVFIDAVKRPIALAGERIVLGASVGTACSPQDGECHEVLLKRAGLALKEAKTAGRDAIAAYRTELELASQLRAVLTSEFRLALDGGQFVLMVQPKVSLATGAVVGGEALIRWAHPRRGMLAPGVFLGIAQDIGAMVTIDQWVLRQSLAYCAQLEDMGLSVPLSINLSVDSLADVHLVDRVREALLILNVPPKALEVEIPEGALMHDVQTSGKILGELNDMGVRISIDDFGTGYSSFAYLAQFPVHALKIDRSFVNELTTSEASRTIVKSIIRLAHSLSLDVVAEGAEEQEQLAMLRKFKCDSVQGYVIAKPLPWAEFVAFAAQSRQDTTIDPTCI